VTGVNVRWLIPTTPALRIQLRDRLRRHALAGLGQVGPNPRRAVDPLRRRVELDYLARQVGPALLGGAGPGHLAGGRL